MNIQYRILHFQSKLFLTQIRTCWSRLVYCSSNMAPVGDISADEEYLVERAIKSLENEKIIAVPTDTIYGLAGLAQCTNAVNALYRIKGRNNSNPISICVGDIDDVYKWGNVTVSKALLSRLLPGPVTAVFERTVALNPCLNPGSSLVGIRIPNHNFVRQICQACKVPLALTSANTSGDPSSLSIKEFEHLWPELDLVCDGGVLADSAKSRQGSTVVDLSKTGKYTIIRPGSAETETTTLLKEYGLHEEQKTR